MSTIYDIAKKVKLSPSTVARALSGSGYCSQSARDKVLAAAREMHYVPVQAAKSLKSKITKKIMLSLPDMLNPYYFSLISSINDVMEENGYHTILHNSQRSAAKELSLVESLQERFVDGLVMATFDFNNALLEALARLDIPVVLLNRCAKPGYTELFDMVYVDQTKATQIATAHCIEQGHKRIAFLGDNIKGQTGRERLRGYRKALDRAGLPFTESLVVQSDHTFDGGYAAFKEYLSTGPDFTAIVSSNDLMGVASLNACREAGLEMPRDYSIVTLDNTDYCLCTSPQMTSVNMMQDQMGMYAAQRVMRRIQDAGQETQSMVLGPKLVVRSSVKKV